MRPGRVTFAEHPRSSISLPLADRDLTIGRSLAYAVDRFANRSALAFEDRTWTYQGLAADVNRCARALVAAGVGKGTRVGFFMGSRPEFVILAYATAMVGGVGVFISTFSTDEELDWIIRHSDTSLLVIDTTIRSRAVAHDLVERHPSVIESDSAAISCLALPYLRRVVVVPSEGRIPDLGLESWDQLMYLAEKVDQGIVSPREVEVHPSDDAIMLYTSGSTSRPKAVLHAHRAPVMQGFCMANAMAIGEDDRTWTSFPIFWTAGWLTAAVAPLLVGACSVLQEFNESDKALGLIERHRVTCVRQTIHDEMRLVAAQLEDPHDLSSVTIGVVTESLRSFTSAPPDNTEWCGWGMTETFTNATVLPLDADYQRRQTTMGRPVPGVRIRIRDKETGTEMPAGAIGEITVSGLSLMRGYYKGEPALPLDSFGYLRTNDAGYMTQDGFLVFLGRLDRLIKTAGVNVSAVEIEERLREWGRLGTCTVVGVAHPTLGTSPVLCVARRPDDSVTEGEIGDYLRSCLARYKVPKVISFFEENEFPSTVSGKVNVGVLHSLVVQRLMESEIDIEWKEALRASGGPLLG